MNIIYANMPVPRPMPRLSVFLAGPTPRDKETKSWRPNAVKILKKLKYTGTVILPEYNPMPTHVDYDTQVEWEHEALTHVTWIVFWVPRELKKMPAFTTNVEFGRFAHEWRTLYGRPDDAPKNRYLDWWYSKCHPHRIIAHDLESLLKQII